VVQSTCTQASFVNHQLLSNKSTSSGDESGRRQRSTLGRKQLCRHWTMQCSELFPNIALLLQILATFPIATVEAERMFSKVEQTLTAIRSTMHESRLEALLLLQQHRTLTPSVAAVIDRFALTAARRLKFLL